MHGLEGSVVLLVSYACALAAPLILLACGASAKKLARGSPWIAEDFFFGVELTLASLGACIVNLLFVIRSARGFDGRITANVLFFAIGFFLLLWMLAVHRDWLSRPQNRKGQLFWLLGVCNAVAVGLMMAFVVFMEGGRT